MQTVSNDEHNESSTEWPVKNRITLRQAPLKPGRVHLGWVQSRKTQAFHVKFSELFENSVLFDLVWPHVNDGRFTWFYLTTYVHGVTGDWCIEHVKRTLVTPKSSRPHPLEQSRPILSECIWLSRRYLAIRLALPVVTRTVFPSILRGRTKFCQVSMGCWWFYRILLGRPVRSPIR